LLGCGVFLAFSFSWYDFICLCEWCAITKKRSAVNPQRGPDNLADYATPATTRVHRAGKPSSLGSPRTGGIPRRKKLRFLAAVTCYLQSSANTDRKVVTGLLRCSDYSGLLEQPSLGPKAREFKPITRTGKARGVNTTSPLLGPRLPFTDVLYFMCNLLTKTTCFFKLSAIYCFAKSVSRYTSDQRSSTWEPQNFGDVLKSEWSQGRNLLTWLQASWPKHSAGCTSPTHAPAPQATQHCGVAVKAGWPGSWTVPGLQSLSKSSQLLAGTVGQL